MCRAPLSTQRTLERDGEKHAGAVQVSLVHDSEAAGEADEPLSLSGAVRGEFLQGVVPKMRGEE